MTNEQQPSAPSQPRRSARLLIVLAGIIFGQAVLYGPSLIGRKVLLPLDLLKAPRVYLPFQPEAGGFDAIEIQMSDIIYALEPTRRFAVSELHRGRWPMWDPYRFAGAPFIGPKFSPFFLFQCVTASPVILAWSQLLVALVAGAGAYRFCRRVLGVSFWPATIAGWCYPLTGFFVFWQGYYTSWSVCWLPWILMAVDREVRGAECATRNEDGRRLRPAWLQCRGLPFGLSVTTFLVVVSGQLDVAAQVLLVAGLFGLWRLLEIHGGGWFARERSAAVPAAAACQLPLPPDSPGTESPASALRPGPPRCLSRAVLRLAAGWGLGLLLAAPAVLPLLEYTQSGARMTRRAAGEEERPPAGLQALPQIVLPDMYGRTVRWVEGNIFESSAAAYTGVLATLLAAPLAFCSRRHRSLNLFWVCLSFLALSWCLNVPGLVQFLRLPGMRMLSHNRLVFAASFAFLALAATGLEMLLEYARNAAGRVQSASRARHFKWRRWCWVPTAVLGGLCLLCIYWAVFLPTPIGVDLEESIRSGKEVPFVADLDGVRQVQAWFARHFAFTAFWCGAGFMGWLVLWSRALRPSWGFPLIAALLVGDLLWFAHDRSVQCDPALYFPRVPVLEQVAKAAPGRVIGHYCLPANLATICGLRDIRGYDAVDPARLLDLLKLATDTNSPATDYARMQKLSPLGQFKANGDLSLCPILNTLAVRYVIFRDEAPKQSHPAFAGPDYAALVNTSAMPRAYVPERVEVVTNSAARIEKLAAPAFDPREVAYVETPVHLPARCVGRAEIAEENPTRVLVVAKMETAGLLVLADLWDTGWRAYLNGKRVSILKANHAVRGVELPPGDWRLEFRYKPASFVWGMRLAGIAVLALAAGWALGRGRLTGEQDTTEGASSIRPPARESS